MRIIGIIVGIIMSALMIWIAHRIEIDFGRVLNNQGDGKLYNGESYYNYIAYPDRFQENDIVVTVCILNPLNNYCDDVVVRTDYRLFRDAK